jgi:hypothetical protein
MFTLTKQPQCVDRSGQAGGDAPAQEAALSAVEVTPEMLKAGVAAMAHRFRRNEIILSWRSGKFRDIENAAPYPALSVRMFAIKSGNGHLDIVGTNGRDS